MKHLLITTIAAVLLVGCGESQQSAPPAELKPAEPVTEMQVEVTSPPEEVNPAEALIEPKQKAQSLKPLSAADKLLFGAAMAGNINAI